MVPRQNRRYEWLVKAIAEHNSTDCLIWPFQKDRDGYGRLRPAFDGKRVTYGAHRLAFKLTYGHWPTPEALHACDTPSCVNPRHITEGTAAENQRQKAERGRSLRGTQQHDAKLNDSLVLNIRSEYRPYRGAFRELANKYGVTPPLIRQIILGRLWRHVQ